MQERAGLTENIQDIKSLETKLSEVLDLLEIADQEGEEDLIHEQETELKSLLKKAERLQLKSFLSGEADDNTAFLEVNAGAGGTEAQDWAGMLLRMYLRWAEKEGYKTELVQENTGDVAGIKSATVRISGPKAFGWLKTESGVHRLVRISPFDSNARRHTSFAAVRVYPELDDSITIDIEDKDLKIDTYRASGAGGQHVNTTDSAVRITHIPSGIVVQCQNDRSQHRNKAQAMKMLQSRLYELELRRKEEEAMSTHSNKGDNAWGNQIRSYVLQPYQMIKDLRTGMETSNTQAVLDGDITDFLESSLAHRATNKRT
jgi:peptide chain release factor 2